MDPLTPESILAAFPLQFDQGLVAARAARRRRGRARGHMSAVIICGVGGSALSGDLLRNWNEESAVTNRRIEIHKDYGLPSGTRFAPRTTLVICVSYSGNTEETLSAYRAARQRGSRLAVITSGGILARASAHDNVMCISIPRGLPPRFAVGYQFGALIGLLAEYGLLAKGDAQAAGRAAHLLPARALRSQGATLARALEHRIPLIYSSRRNAALGYILKIQFNENTKIPAFANVVPELNHNELNSFAMLSRAQQRLAKGFGVVMLLDPKDSPAIKKRMAATASIIRKNGVRVIPLALSGSSYVARTFRGTLIGQWASLFLAKRYHVDPIPVDLIEKFKRMIR